MSKRYYAIHFEKDDSNQVDYPTIHHHVYAASIILNMFFRAF